MLNLCRRPDPGRRVKGIEPVAVDVAVGNYPPPCQSIGKLACHDLNRLAILQQLVARDAVKRFRLLGPVPSENPIQ